MRDMSSQYQMYDSLAQGYTPTSVPPSLNPEGEMSQYSIPSQSVGPYYSSAIDEAMIYPQDGAAAAPYQSHFPDSNLYPYADPSVFPQQVTSDAYHSLAMPNPPIAMPLPDHPTTIPINLSLDSSTTTSIAPSLTSLEESEYPHYVVRY